MKSAEDMSKIIAGHKLGHRLGIRLSEQAVVQARDKHEPITHEIYE